MFSVHLFILLVLVEVKVHQIVLMFIYSFCLCGFFLGQNSSELRLSNIQSQEVQGVYQCLLKNEYGGKLTDGALLTISSELHAPQKYFGESPLTYTVTKILNKNTFPSLLVLEFGQSEQFRQLRL